MEKIVPPQGTEIWYNTLIPRKWGMLIFDIGGRLTALAIGPMSLAGRLDSWPLYPMALGKTPESAEWFRRNRCHYGELWKRIRRLQHVRNSVLGFVAKPLTLHNEKPNAMVRRVAFTRRTLFSFFVKVLRGTCHETGFQGRAAFLFCVKAAHAQQG